MRSGGYLLVGLVVLFLAGCESRKSTGSSTVVTGADYFLLQADRALQANDPESALTLARRALRQDSTSAPATYLAAEALQQLGRIQQAETAYRKVTALDPSFRNARLRLGSLAYERGDVQAALDHFREESKVQQSPTVLYNLGVAYVHLDRPDSALIAFKRALNLDPNHASTHVAISNLFELDGDLDQAVASAERALHLRPTDPFVQKHLGLLYLSTGRSEKAVELLEQAARQDLLDSEAYYALGQAYQRLGRSAEADRSLRQHARAKAGLQSIDDLKAKIEANPSDLALIRRLAHLYVVGRHYDDAIRQYRSVLSLDPTNLPARTELATVMAAKGDQAGAEREYRAVLDADPKRAHVWMYLGTLLVRSGRADEGEQALARAVELDPVLQTRVDSLRHAG